MEKVKKNNDKMLTRVCREENSHPPLLGLHELLWKPK